MSTLKLIKFELYCKKTVDDQFKFKIWKDKYYEFISQKSVDAETGEIWFTHARLRSAAFNLGKSILNKNVI